MSNHPEAKTPQAAAREPAADAYTEGYDAFQHDASLMDNPYPPYSDEREEWQNGLIAARNDNSQFGVGA